MRICLFADGESIHTQRWCLHFHALGHEVHLISFKNVQIPHIQVHTVDSGTIHQVGGNWKVLFQYHKIKRILKAISPDIFHALYATSYGITGALCGFHPYVITALGSDILISPKQSRIYRILLRYAFSKADWITVMADHMKTETLRLGVSESKITTLPFGVDPAIFFPANVEKTTENFVVLSTRNFELVYNIPHLIKAVANAKKRIPTIQLKLIGAGSLKSEYEVLIRDLKLEENVVFLGKLPQTEIASQMNQSDVFVTVSLSDGNNISLNEAMACQTFAIATKIPANEQWITHGENGFLVEIDDVDTLANQLVEVFENYASLQEKAIPLNEQLIQEKGIWANNMAQVEQKYVELIHLFNAKKR